MLYFALALYACRVLWALFRLLRDRLPDPADAVILSVFFYNVPLAILAFYKLDWIFPGYIVFLTYDAADGSAAEMTLIATFVATLGIDIGSKCYARRSSTSFFLVNDRILLFSAFGIVCLCVFVVIAGALAMGLQNYFVDYNSQTDLRNESDYVALIYFAFEAAGVFSFIAYCSRHNGNPIVVTRVLILALIFILGMALVRGKRLEPVLAVLPMFMLFWSTRLVNFWQRSVVVACFVVMFAALASLRSGELPTFASIAFDSISEGVYAGHMTPGIINAIDNESIDPENGSRIFIGFLAIVPRFLFPGKDDIVYRSLADIGQFNPLGATSLLGEVYLQGGMGFVFGFFLVIGFCAQLVRVDSLRIDLRFGLPLRNVLYLVFIGTFLFHFRDGLIIIVKLSLQMVLLLGILCSIGKVRRGCLG